MNRLSRTQIHRSIPTIAIAGALVLLSATSGATAALVITGQQIKDSSVTTKDIKNGSLTKRDLSSSAVRSLKGAAGAAGPAGATGPAGAEGPAAQTGPAGPAGPAGSSGAAGAPGISGYEIVSNSSNISPNAGGEVQASCPGSKKVLSAAGTLQYSFNGTAVDIDPSGTSATAYAWNPGGSWDIINIDVVCGFVS